MTLSCRVANKRGTLQWTRDGFGLGIERNLTGFDRYRMTGTDEEGERKRIRIKIWFIFETGEMASSIKALF